MYPFFKLHSKNLRFVLTNPRTEVMFFKILDGNPDPGPVFLAPEVQTLLKTLTRIDLAKVYRKRKQGEKRLAKPVYKFMTSEELEAVVNQMKKKVDYYLQMPPVLAARKPITRVISDDPALQGLNTSTFVFTDISFGLRDSERIIWVRDPEGSLKEADWDLRDRMNQLYFPKPQRELKHPKMFQDEHFEKVLDRKEYLFILDRACVQFEPNDPFYQKIITITYQHINDNNEFAALRSTRHFGGMAFFLAWHKTIDNLLLDLVENEQIGEAEALVELYTIVHKISLNDKDQILDFYIKEHSTKRAALELALQAYRNAAKEKEELEKGIKRAHGYS